MIGARRYPRKANVRFLSPAGLPLLEIALVGLVRLRTYVLTFGDL